MAVIYEDFIRCKVCNGGDFKEEVILTFNKLLRERDRITDELDAMEREFHYMCRDCGTELKL